MRRIYTLFALLGLVATSCEQESQEPMTPQQGPELRITAQPADFSRATDTAFETGDRVGLFLLLGEEQLAANANLVMAYVDNAGFEADSSGNLNPMGETLYWYSESYKATLTAYYPYQEGWSYLYFEKPRFTVNADQSSHVLYTASDLMVATTTASPSEEAVALDFRHRMCKVALTIDNQSEEQIEAVYLSNLYGSVELDPESGALETVGSRGTIKANCVESGDGELMWMAVVAPDPAAQPELQIITASQKQYSFSLAAAVDFASGKQFNASLTLTAESTSTDIESSIGEWSDDKDLNFNYVEAPISDALGLVGDHNNWSAPDTPLRWDGAQYYVAMGVEFLAEDGFKVRGNETWDNPALNIGMQSSGSIAVNGSVNLVARGNSENILVPADGTYDIYFDYEGMELWLMESGLTPGN